MDYYSVWPAFLIAALLVGIFSLPLFSALDQEPHASGSRISNLDGLRFFLALAVLTQHTSIRRIAATTGIVALPPSPFFSYVGSFGVAVFFMITGFLFWGKLLEKGGRPKWAELYVNRFFRIVPLYWSLIAAYFVFVLVRADFHIAVSLRMAIGQAWRWLALGAYQLPPPFLDDTHSMSVVGQTWTLFYEWTFYVSLPALALLAPCRHAWAAICVGLALALIIGHQTQSRYCFYVGFFLVGMLTASFLRMMPKIHGDGEVRSVVALLSLLEAFYLGHDSFSVYGVIFLGGFFALVASGSSLFRLLHVTGAVRLGHASYSIYLMHGLVLSTIFLPGVLGVAANRSPAEFWSIAAMTALCVALFSCATYLFIERPGIRLGRSVYGKVGRHHHAHVLAQEA